MSDFTDDWLNEEDGDEVEDFFLPWEDDLPDFFKVDQTTRDEEDEFLRERRLTGFFSAFDPKLDRNRCSRARLSPTGSGMSRHSVRLRIPI